MDHIHFIDTKIYENLLSKLKKLNNVYMHIVIFIFVLHFN